MIDSSLATYTAIGVGAVFITGLAIYAARQRRRSKKFDTEYYTEKWKTLQGMLCDNKMWPLAVIDADKLLEEALRCKKYKGKSMGEKLVAAQHDLTNNDLVWFGHKLRNKLVHEQGVKLKKNDVKDALLGIRSALKDLGALK